ncbi:MAG: O-antigen ligase family protein [Parvibaculales bacterium]
MQKKTIWAFFAVLFVIGVNIHIPDLGETYVTRNLFMWVFIALLNCALWLQPIKNQTVKWHPIWAMGLFLPVIGSVLVLLGNIVGGYTAYHVGHYFLPGMLLAFALFCAGLMQHDFSDDDWARMLVIILAALMPQYVLHMISTSPIVFFPVTLQIHQIFFKEFLGFGQYNLYGSFFAGLMLLCVWAGAFLQISKRLRWVLLGLFFIYALDLATMNSKTGLVGFWVGLSFMAIHALQNRDDTLIRRQVLQTFGLLLLAVVIGVISLYQADAKLTRTYSWTAEGHSFSTRYSMWIIALQSFADAPFFGHGLGSYIDSYTKYFANNGLASGLTFYPTVSLPHNLLVHLLSETGLIGTLLLIGPLVWLAVHILRCVPRRWVVASLCFPVIFHTQLEYPYIASGGHYFILALALALAVSRQDVLTHRLQLGDYGDTARKSVFASVAFVSAGVIAVSLHMQWATYRAATNFQKDSFLSLTEYVQRRFGSADVSHPVIGERMRAMSYLVLARKAMEAKRPDVLNKIVLPVLEQEVVPRYNNSGVWEITLRTYFEVGQFDKAYALVDRIALFDPKRAGQYRVILDRSLKDYEVRPTRPQQ